jgi:transposase
MSDRFDHKLEHKLETKPAEDDGAAKDVRRIELITGTGRRRRWSSDDKVRIVVESFTPGVNVSDVARRHGMSPQQLFAWRREARAMFETTEVTTTPAGPEQAPAFAQVVLAAPASPPPKANAPGAIEIVIGDATVRVIGQIPTETITAALRAVRRSS